MRQVSRRLNNLTHLEESMFPLDVDELPILPDVVPLKHIHQFGSSTAAPEMHASSIGPAMRHALHGPASQTIPLRFGGRLRLRKDPSSVSFELEALAISVQGG